MGHDWWRTVYRIKEGVRRFPVRCELFPHGIAWDSGAIKPQVDRGVYTNVGILIPDGIRKEMRNWNGT